MYCSDFCRARTYPIASLSSRLSFGVAWCILDGAAKPLIVQDASNSLARALSLSHSFLFPLNPGTIFLELTAAVGELNVANQAYRYLHWDGALVVLNPYVFLLPSLLLVFGFIEDRRNVFNLTFYLV